jgi:hypothetical protein
MSERKVPGWLLPAGVVVVVVALVTIALARGPVELDPDTPEGAVQEYLLAISQQRYDDAMEVLHEEWRGGCEGGDLANFPPGDFSAELGSEPGFGVIREDFMGAPGEVAPPTIPDDAVQVEVIINHQPGGVGSWSEPVVFELAFDGDFWWLVGDPWPYFIWSCRESL